MNVDEYSIENEAESLYLKGVELEYSNNYYDAMKYYRKALRLVPDIDKKIFKKSQFKESTHNNNDQENFSGETNIYLNCDVNDYYDGDEALIDRISRILDKFAKICVPNKPQKGRHISDLPMEVIMYIWRWVVSDELDLRSLDQCALVCRGFYLCARDSYIWKSACERIWKNEEVTLFNYDSWRDMFINRLRIATNGCYISETKYHRQGEISFQDQNYRPYHLVVYFRYLRFFADGNVLMINTPETPSIVVTLLKSKNPKSAAVFRGSYTVINNFVYVIVKVKRKHVNSLKTENKTKTVNLIYHMTFEIKRYKKWKTKLLWKEYKWLCTDEARYEENFEIQKNSFPSLLFSRVKSYNSESEKPLP
ncbi:hypothetical protein PGB90_002117 [Kerria lacca]